MITLSFADTALGYWNEYSALALNWLTSPQAWLQFGLLAVSFGLAWIVNGRLVKVLENLLKTLRVPAFMRKPMDFAVVLLPLCLPLLAYGFTAIGEAILKTTFGSAEVIAFGKRVFLFLAARILVKSVFYSPFLRLLGKYVIVPAAALYALGLLNPLIAFLGDTVVGIGNIEFSLLAIVRGVIAGSILFWLGRWSNDQSATYIRAQEDMRVPTRELATKAVEMGIFGGAFLLLMNIMGINRHWCWPGFWFAKNRVEFHFRYHFAARGSGHSW